MKKIFLPITVITVFILFSCGGETTTKNEAAADNVGETCFYSYDDIAGAKVSWTAFKTSDKVAVGGRFDQVNVKAGDKSTKITDVLETIIFNIPISSTNTANEDRDAKLVKSFFGAMNQTDIILGQVKSVTGDNTSGTCVFYLTLNNIEKETSIDYTVEDNLLKLSGEIDLLNWEGEGAISSLNKVCEALHTGADGVTKTWSIVELGIEATLKKECH